MKSYTTLRNEFGKLSLNKTTENLDLGIQIMNDEQRYLLQKFFSNEGSFETPTISNIQFYPAPPNYSKMKTVTITVGQLKWTIPEIQTREEWDKLNVFPYYADIPTCYFVYPGGDHGVQIGIYPIPSTDGNTITFNYKYRVPDLSMEDDTSVISTGTVDVTHNDTAVTGNGTSFLATTNQQLESRWIKIPQPTGDNLWYQIASVDSASDITLYAPYQGINVNDGAYTVGQMPIIMEDFQDMLVYKALVFYYTSIVDNPKKAQQYQNQYDIKMKQLEAYAGSNSVQVNLRQKALLKNPNLFPQSIG